MVPVEIRAAYGANAYGNVLKTSLYKLRMNINPSKVNHPLETKASTTFN